MFSIGENACALRDSDVKVSILRTFGIKRHDEIVLKPNAQTPHEVFRCIGLNQT